MHNSLKKQRVIYRYYCIGIAHYHSCFPGCFLEPTSLRATTHGPPFGRSSEKPLSQVKPLGSASIHLETRGSLALAVLWLPKVVTAKLGNIPQIRVGLQRAAREGFWNFSAACLVCCRDADP